MEIAMRGRLRSTLRIMGCEYPKGVYNTGIEHCRDYRNWELGNVGPLHLAIRGESGSL